MSLPQEPEEERDWGDLVAQSFEGAAAEATSTDFGSREKNNKSKNTESTHETDSQSVFVCGYRVSPDWTSAVWVFLFTSLIYFGFVALHVVRIIDDHKNNNSTAKNSTSSDDENILKAHTFELSVTSISITFVLYLWTMINMFLAVFTNPGILLRRHEIIAREQDLSMSGSGGGLFFDDDGQQQQVEENHDQSAKKLENNNSSSNNDKSSPPLGPSRKSNGRRSSAASSTASSIVFASNNNHALARGSVVRNSHAKPGDLLSNDDGTSTSGGGGGGGFALSSCGGDKDDPAQEYVNIKKINIPTPYCTTCHIRRPVRASHCVNCQNCVLGFDHHCGVIGACIGHFNLRFFTGFVWGTGFLSWFCGISCALVAVSENSDSSGKFFVAAIGFAVICLLFGIQLGCNLGGHYFCLWRKGFTHREWVKRDLLYGNSTFMEDSSPFRTPSCLRQCAYMWCPLPADANLKSWAEERDDEIFPKPAQTIVEQSSNKYFGGGDDGKQKNKNQLAQLGESMYKNVSKPYGFLPFSCNDPPQQNQPIQSQQQQLSKLNFVNSQNGISSETRNSNITSPLLVKQKTTAVSSATPPPVDRRVLLHNNANEISPQSAVSLDTIHQTESSLSRQRFYQQGNNNISNNGKNGSHLSEGSDGSAAKSTTTTETRFGIANAQEGVHRNLNVSTLLDATNSPSKNAQTGYSMDYGATSPASNYNAL